MCLWVITPSVTPAPACARPRRQPASACRSRAACSPDPGGVSVMLSETATPPGSKAVRLTPFQVRGVPSACLDLGPADAAVSGGVAGAKLDECFAAAVRAVRGTCSSSAAFCSRLLARSSLSWVLVASSSFWFESMLASMPCRSPPLPPSAALPARQRIEDIEEMRVNCNPATARTQRQVLGGGRRGSGGSLTTGRWDPSRERAHRRDGGVANTHSHRKCVRGALRPATAEGARQMPASRCRGMRRCGVLSHVSVPSQGQHRAGEGLGGRGGGGGGEPGLCCGPAETAASLVSIDLSFDSDCSSLSSSCALSCAPAPDATAAAVSRGAVGRCGPGSKSFVRRAMSGGH